MSVDLDSLRGNPDIVARNPDLFTEPVEKPSKPRKYRNTPTFFQGREDASAKEAKRAQELDLMEKAGEIAGWIPQWPFCLAGGIKYVADFVVLQNDGRWRAEDVKSAATRRIAAYRMKRRLFRERFKGMEIQEV